MISLTPPTARPCLEEFARETPPPPFDGLAFQSCKGLTRSDLLANQHHQCAFCESPIKDIGQSTHLDHLITQDADPNRRFDITNLVACCQNESSCGHKHGSHSVPDELNPYIARNLHLALPCDSMGELYSDSLSEDAWAFAKVRLNLNAPGLKSARAAVLIKLRQQTIAQGTNARRRIANLSTRGVGFISLHAQELGRFGYSVPPQARS
jgi:hypothetical protein